MPDFFQKAGVLVCVLCATLTWHVTVADEFAKFELPFGYVRVIGNDFELPYTRHDILNKLRAPRDSVRVHEGGDVVLAEGQVIWIQIAQDDVLVASLDWLDSIPKDRLRGAALTFYRVTDESIKKLKKFDGLTELIVRCDDMDITLVVDSCPHLKRLEFHSQEIRTPPAQGKVFTDDAIAEIAKLKELRCLRIQGREITDKSLEMVATWPKLEAFEIKMESKISDKGLLVLATGPQLREVAVWMTPGITREGLLALAKAPKLEHLILYHADHLDKKTIAELRESLGDGLLELKQPGE
jgi:hypothetical protein